MPLSDDPEKRAKQLANLPNLRGELPAGAWWSGAAPHLKHGLRTRRPSADALDPVLDAVIADLTEVLPDPLVDERGEVRPWARESVWALGVLKLGCLRCSRYLAQHGETDERGHLRAEVDGLRKHAESYRRALAEEAMTLRSRLAAELDVARHPDFAEALAEDWRREQAEAIDAEAEGAEEDS